jgi:hypothetical protein
MMGNLMPAQVLAIGHMRDGDYKYVEDDIRGVVKAAKEAGTCSSARLAMPPMDEWFKLLSKWHYMHTWPFH